MKRSFFWCFPWDLEDEGLDTALGRMAGEIGVSAVSVVAAYHGVSGFRGRDSAGPRTIEREAGAHFQPDRSLYGDARIRPVSGAWMKNRNPLKKIGEAAEKTGLGLRVLASCCRNETLVARHLMAGCVDVFGDPIFGRLCPSNPDVREYVASLAADLAGHYPVETLELDELHFGGLPRRYAWACLEGLGLSEADAALGAWCFCPSCRQRAEAADINVDRLVERVQARLRSASSLSPEKPEGYASLLASDVGLAAFHAVRVDTIVSLVRMIRSRLACELVLHAGAASSSAGMDIRALAPACDGFVLPWRMLMGSGPSRSSAVVDAGGMDCVEVAHACCPPLVEDGAALVSQVHAVAEGGCRGVGFFHYGAAPEPCLDWVRQAIRYARRESR